MNYVFFTQDTSSIGWSPSKITNWGNVPMCSCTGEIRNEPIRLDRVRFVYCIKNIYCNRKLSIIRQWILLMKRNGVLIWFESDFRIEMFDCSQQDCIGTKLKVAVITHSIMDYFKESMKNLWCLIIESVAETQTCHES